MTGPLLDLQGFADRVDRAGGDAVGASWRPLILKLQPRDEGPFRELCDAHHIVCVDPIDRQIDDLAAVRLPGPDAAERRRRFIDRLLAMSGGRFGFGNWVFLPWHRTVVHLLDDEAFLEVVTNRNRDKITLEEQRRLRTKRIGVVGLSVGGEAAVAVAQEHLCGAIVLADFDRLDLSNLNRMGAGVGDLGQNKAVIAARRIASLDPYLDVTLVPEGVTPDNADGFLNGLDLLIEECDGLEMKFELRALARARGLNVVFAADERGFLSVEPYGCRPGLPVFHGRIARPQPPREAYDTPLEFLEALTEWMGGWDAISTRSRASLEQVGSALCGYPQLASEARLAAGQIGHVARRLLLGERLAPAILNVDLDALVGSAAPDVQAR